MPTEKPGSRTPAPQAVSSNAHASASPTPTSTSASHGRGEQRSAAPAPSAAEREAQLLRQAQAGDRVAFGQFVMLTQDRLYTLLVRIIGDREEAKELSQETYLKALGGLAGFRNGAAPYTWIYRIAVNLAVGRLRKVRRHRVFSLDAPPARSGHGEAAAGHDRPSGGDTPDAALIKRERDRHVIAALGRLDSEYRAVLVMRDIDGMDYKEISDVLELPIGTVKSRLFRARLALREELNRYLSAARPGAPTAPKEGGARP